MTEIQTILMHFKNWSADEGCASCPSLDLHGRKPSREGTGQALQDAVNCGEAPPMLGGVRLIVAMLCPDLILARFQRIPGYIVPILRWQGSTSSSRMSAGTIHVDMFARVKRNGKTSPTVCHCKISCFSLQKSPQRSTSRKNRCQSA